MGLRSWLKILITGEEVETPPQKSVPTYDPDAPEEERRSSLRAAFARAAERIREGTYESIPDEIFETNPLPKVSESDRYFADHAGKTWLELFDVISGGVEPYKGDIAPWDLIEDKVHKQDLDLMLSICASEVKPAEEQGGIPAPFYFWRAAILFSKRKLYEKELQVCQFYYSISAAGGNEAGARYERIMERIPKAQAKLDKQNGK